MEPLKRLNVFANLSNISTVPSVALGTAETFERLCETLNVSAVPREKLGAAETF